MKDEYDFSKRERGKFHRPDAELHIPVHLDKDVADFLQKVAEQKGVEVDSIVNEWLRRSIRSVESAK